MLGVAFSLAEAFNLAFGFVGQEAIEQLKRQLGTRRHRRRVVRRCREVLPDRASRRAVRRLLKDAEFRLLLATAASGEHVGVDDSLARRIADAVPGAASGGAWRIGEALGGALHRIVREDATPAELALLTGVEEVHASVKAVLATLVTNNVEECGEVLYELAERSGFNMEDAGYVGSASARAGDAAHLAELHVPRAQEGVVIDAVQPGAVLVLVGDAGNGKTSSLWKIDLHLLGRQDLVVWFLRSGQFSGSSEGADGAQALVGLVKRGIACALAQGQVPVLVLDTIDILLHDDTDRLRALSLIGAVRRGGGVLVTASRPSEAHLLPADVTKVPLRGYSDDELVVALRNHENVYALAGASSAHALKEVIAAVRWNSPLLPILRRPLTLRLLFELYTPETLPAEINAFELFDRFWRSRVMIDLRPGAPFPADERDLAGTAESLALAMLAAGVPSVSRDALEHGPFHTAIRGADLTTLRSRGVTDRDERLVTFFHQAFFEHCAARAVVSRGGEQGLMGLLDRAEGRLTDTFLWPVAEQAAVMALNAEMCRDRVVDRTLGWILDPSRPISFQAGLAVWAQSNGCQSDLTDGVCGTLLGDGTPDTVRRIVSSSSALLSTRLPDLLQVIRAATSSDRPATVGAILELTSVVASHNPGEMRSIWTEIGPDIPFGLLGPESERGVLALCRALLRAGLHDDSWTSAEIAGVLSRLRLEVRGNALQLVFGHLDDLDGDMAVVWIDALGEWLHEPGIRDGVISLLHRGAQSRLDAHGALDEAERARPGLADAWLAVAVQLGERLDSVERSDLLTRLFRLDAQLLHRTADRIAAFAQEDDKSIRWLLDIVREFSTATGTRGRLKAAALAAGSLPLPVLRRYVESGALDWVTAADWRHPDRLGPLLASAALARQPLATSVFDEIVQDGAHRERSRLAAQLEPLADSSGMAREVLVRLAVELDQPMRLARLLKTTSDVIENGQDTETTAIRRYLLGVADGDVRIQETAIRIRRALANDEHSVEAGLPDPDDVLRPSSSASVIQNVLVLTRLRTNDGVTDPEHGAVLARQFLGHSVAAVDLEARLTVVTCLAAPPVVGRWEEALVLATEGSPDPRLLMALAPFCEPGRHTDAAQALPRLLSVAKATASMSRQASQRVESAMSRGLKGVISTLDLGATEDLVVAMAAATPRMGVLAIRCAAPIFGPDFAGVVDRLMLGGGLPREVVDFSAEIKRDLERPIGSAAWPELLSLIEVTG